jgi:hypothetical protein
LSTPKRLLAGSLLAIAMNVAGVQLAQAEPLTPLTPAELQYLQQLHSVFSVSRDNAAFRSDGELLDAGRYVCHQRTNGLVGYEATLVSPVITQLAFIYLCPN